MSNRGDRTRMAMVKLRDALGDIAAVAGDADREEDARAAGETGLLAASVAVHHVLSRGGAPTPELMSKFETAIARARGEK